MTSVATVGNTGSNSAMTPGLLNIKELPLLLPLLANSPGPWLPLVKKFTILTTLSTTRLSSSDMGGDKGMKGVFAPAVNCMHAFEGVKVHVSARPKVSIHSVDLHVAQPHLQMVSTAYPHLF
jgi:hypothetical protein